MTDIDELIAEHCPNGVEYKTLEAVGLLVRGNGMPRSAFVDEGVGCIHYGQIYTHFGTWATKTISSVPPDYAAKLAKVDCGDLVVTNTSENVADLCKAVAWLGEEQIVTGGHATVVKHEQDPKFLAYLFQTPTVAAQVRKLATGTKVMDVSASKLGTIRVPVPPIEVQRAIVSILDRFAQLQAELQSELQAELQQRQSQYAHYRQLLLDFDAAPVELVEHAPLREVAYFENGKAHERVVDVDGDIALLTARFISTQGAAARYVRSENVRTPASTDQISLVMSDLPNGRALARAFYVDQDNRYAANQRVCLLTVISTLDVLPRFLYYVVDRNRQLLAYDSGVDQTHLKKDQILDIDIPIPQRAEQERIVGILDKLHDLTRDLSSELLREVEARRKQYAFYRDQLLTFAEKLDA